MKFKKDDLDTRLRYQGNEPLGVYDQTHWEIRTGANATDIMSQTVTLHEFMHHELNNTTIYGFLLQGYAYLSHENTPLQAHYNNILYTLVEACRTAHEVHATWMSIALLSTGVNDPLYEQLLTDNEEYLDYYDRAAQIVQSLPDLYLRKQIITALINICFQSQTITEKAIAGFSTFDPDALDPDDFPTRRLHIVTEACISLDWIKMLNDFVQTQQDIWHTLLSNALAGNGDDKALSDVVHQQDNEALLAFIYNHLAVQLKERGLLSLPYMGHLQYAERLLAVIDKLAPFSKSLDPMVMNSQPYDITRSNFRNFENETLLFTNRPINCIILRPDELTAQEKTRILNGIGEYPHIFITARTYFFMNEQYAFPVKEDAEWCANKDGAFTAIRYADFVEEKRFIVYIPFPGPAELQGFLKDKQPGIPVVASISETARNKAGWWAHWENFFINHVTTTCLLLDISPLYYIERVFCDATVVLYEKMKLRMEEEVKCAILFDFRDNDRTEAFFLTPCSEIYARAINSYIKQRVPSFENRIDIPEEHLQNLLAIISHIFRDEHKHYFWANTQWA